jgi:hypothetical protein
MHARSYYLAVAGSPAEALVVQHYYAEATKAAGGASADAPSQALPPWRMQPLPASVAPLELSLLLGWMLTVDPARRPTAELLLK